MNCHQGYVTQFLAALIGSFILFTVLIASGHPIIVGLTVMVLIFAVGSGAYFNPAATFMFFLNGDLNSTQLGFYIVAQFIAAIAAYLFYTYVLQPQSCKINRSRKCRAID